MSWDIFIFKVFKLIFVPELIIPTIVLSVIATIIITYFQYRVDKESKIYKVQIDFIKDNEFCTNIFENVRGLDTIILLERITKVNKIPRDSIVEIKFTKVEDGN